MNIFYYYILSFILGCCIGSFSNVCIFRWLKEESVIFKPSHCLKCQAPIKWYDNIPIISYFILHGKCRNCLSPISKQYPLVEFITGILFMVIFNIYSFTWETIQMMFVAWMFVVATVTDIKERCIPNELILVGLVGIIINFIFGTITFQMVLLGFIPSLVFLGLGKIVEYFEKVEAIGGGDIKFLFVLGGIMGIIFPLYIIFIGSCMSIIIYFPIFISDLKNKTKTYIPLMVPFAVAFIEFLIYRLYSIYFI